MKQSTITKLLPVAIVCLVLGALYSSLTVTAQEAGSFGTKLYFTENGDKLVVKSAGVINMETGAVLQSEGTPIPVTVLKNQFVAHVPVLAATPVAGTNIYKLGANAIPTHAANLAGLLPTPSALNEQATICSAAANTVRIKPGGTNTINGGSAGAYLPIATAGCTVCTAQTLTNWSCNPDVQPTPQGP